MLATACADDSTSTSSDKAGGSGNKEPIIIGMPAELTGPTATPSSLGATGVELAVSQINADGGIDGRKIELVTIDTAGDAAKLVQSITEMKDQGAVAIVGPVAGSLCAAAAPTLIKLDLPGACLSPADLPKADDRIFGIGVDLAQIDKQSFEYLGTANGSVGVLIPRTPVGDLVKKHIASSTPEGVKIETEEFNTSDTSTKPQLQKLIDRKVGALFIANCGALSLTAAREAVDLGYEGKILLYNCFASNSAAAALKGFTNGNIETFAPNFILKATEPTGDDAEAIKKYEDAGGEPEIVMAAGWDGMYAMAGAIEKAGSTDSAAIMTTLEDDYTYTGVWSSGTITADDHRGTKTEGALIPAAFTAEGTLEAVDAP